MNRDPVPIAATAIAAVAAIAYASPSATRATRLRQTHEINPGAFHEATAITPDTCPHCHDEPEENP